MAESLEKKKKLIKVQLVIEITTSTLADLGCYSYMLQTTNIYNIIYWW
jgi:hypothetical protein